MKHGLRLAGVPLALALLLGSLAPSLALDRSTRLQVMSAVVQIGWVGVNGNKVYNVNVGSGTIISADGLILTNCHVADPVRYGMPRDQVPDFDYLGISLTIRSDQPPQPSYLAEVVVADPVLDLAVIRITRGLDLKPIDAAKLKLPFLKLGDSDQVEVGDELNIFGYPGIGGETVTFTKGVVAGFSLDAAIDGRAWIKTDATIAGGNSGGTGVDEQGLLIGVPTRAGAGGDEYVDCRRLADTNSDGRIDDRDSCIPTGGFINALRPVKLALPLIEAASRGLAYQQPVNEPPDVPPPAGEPRFTNLFFSPGVTDLDQPTTVVTGLPSGSRSLYLFFDYENMTPDMTYELRVKVNGRDNSDWGLPASQWNGDERGLWWVGWSDADLRDGTYALHLLVDGRELASAEIEVGGSAIAAPAFSNVVLSLESTADDRPVKPAVILPAGTKRLLAFFEYKNMAAGTSWTRTWKIDGQPFTTKTEKWSQGKSGRYVLELTTQKGLPAGAYRLELSIDGELAALSTFWLTGGQGQGIAFQSPVFAESIDRQGKPVRPAKSFDSGLPELHTFSDYTGMEDGLNAVLTWTLDGQKVVETPYDWDGGASGQFHGYIQSNTGSLPDGAYGVELTVEGQSMFTGQTTIGGSPKPTPAPTPPASGVRVHGTVVDLDTQDPIAGALFLVLNPGINMDKFQWTADEVYTAAETDQDGAYELPALLARGECYTFVIGADGYWTYSEDDICIPDNAKAVVEVPVQLEKK